ncbi:MAG: DNA polymerase III subunit delta' [Pseudomonadota bacterium]
MAETLEEDLEPLHPRLTRSLRGHEAAEQRLLDAYLSGRMHHAWILGGPAGIGKATLAYRFATFVLANPDPASLLAAPQSLDVDAENLVARRIVAQAHPDLLLVTPAWDQRNKRFKTEITVAEARQASSFFARTAGEGGWRVCIVDPAARMNPNAANALLKILEEPPERALFLLIADAPGRLLRTIRSRCLRLDLKPLEEDITAQVLQDLALRDPALDLSNAAQIAALAGGSPGRAIQMVRDGGYKRFEEFLAIAKGLPNLNPKACLKLAQQLAARNAAQEFLQFCELLLSWLPEHIAKAARSGAAQPEVRHPGAWAGAYDEINRSLRQVNALNLDKQAAILSVLDLLAHAAAEPAPSPSSTASSP